MGFEYLKNTSAGNNKNWAEITREERYFCAELFYALKDPLVKQNFVAKTLIQGLNLPIEITAPAEIGYEVCFYRDYWDYFRRGKLPDITPLPKKRFSPKRTFDLCVFLPKAIIIIEAKVQEGFKNKQLGEFQKDLAGVEALIKETAVGEAPKVYLVGLAAAAYWKNCREETKEKFSGRILSWDDTPLPKELIDRINAICEDRGIIDKKSKSDMSPLMTNQKERKPRMSQIYVNHSSKAIHTPVPGSRHEEQILGRIQAKEEGWDTACRSLEEAARKYPEYKPCEMPTCRRGRGEFR